MEEKDFGKCCEDLNNAMNDLPEPTIRVDENGLLYLTVGYSESDEGIEFYDQALIYCPFCGTKLQDPEKIKEIEEDEEEEEE